MPLIQAKNAKEGIMSNTIQGSGMEGIMRGTAMMEKSATAVTETFEDMYNATDYGGPISDDIVDLSQAIVGMSMAQVQMEASVKVLQTYEELQGILIDLVA